MYNSECGLWLLRQEVNVTFVVFMPTSIHVGQISGPGRGRIRTNNLNLCSLALYHLGTKTICHIYNVMTHAHETGLITETSRALWTERIYDYSIPASTQG